MSLLASLFENSSMDSKSAVLRILAFDLKNITNGYSQCFVEVIDLSDGFKDGGSRHDFKVLPKLSHLNMNEWRE
jgi:hypothetical protein